MKKSKKIIAIILLVICSVIYVSYNIFFRPDVNTSIALSKYGSRGDEVITIQTKLKRWGYYYGNIDGIYGSKRWEFLILRIVVGEHILIQT